MKHLKSYKIFESNDINVREDLTEVCYELTDDGRFGIKIYDEFPGSYTGLWYESFSSRT